MGELLAQRWRDVDFARRTIQVHENWTQGETTTRSAVPSAPWPMAEVVAQRLVRLGQRDYFTTHESRAPRSPSASRRSATSGRAELLAGQ